ncbi:hypothetical protein [Stenotrophomonas rhizophila]
MLHEIFAALWLEPVPIELTAVKQVVSDATDQQQDEFCLALMVRQGLIPVQDSIIHNLLLGRMVCEVANCAHKVLPLRSVNDVRDFSRVSTPARLGRARFFAKPSGLEAIFIARELAKKLESKAFQICDCHISWCALYRLK